MNEKYNSLIASGKEKWPKLIIWELRKICRRQGYETYGRGSPVDHRL